MLLLLDGTIVSDRVELVSNGQEPVSNRLDLVSNGQELVS